MKGVCFLSPVMIVFLIKGQGKIKRKKKKEAEERQRIEQTGILILKIIWQVYFPFNINVHACLVTDQ